jgi:putative RNA 2'-phosphotransferase
MEQNKITQISKRLSLVLRHQPQLIDIQLDSQGWVEVETLINAFSKHFFPITLAELETVVAENNKKRFAFSEDKTKIRASQGHSVEIELGYQAQTPPTILYHGTAKKFWESIQKEGLKKRDRHHVHLSAEIETAKNVGSRHGSPLVLIVEAGKMHLAGFEFFVSENGVWLTDNVPIDFIKLS